LLSNGAIIDLALPVGMFGHMKNLLILTFVALVAFMTAPQVQAADGPYRHVVFFKFKDGTTKDEIKVVEDAFRDLSKKVDTIIGYEWGTNVSPEGKDNGFTHCFFVTFKDKAGLETYLPHPEHKAFGKLAGPHFDKVFVFDYVADK
jgi:hypothetical protein